MANEPYRVFRQSSDDALFRGCVTERFEVKTGQSTAPVCVCLTQSSAGRIAKALNATEKRGKSARS